MPVSFCVGLMLAWCFITHQVRFFISTHLFNPYIVCVSLRDCLLSYEPTWPLWSHKGDPVLGGGKLSKSFLSTKPKLWNSLLREICLSTLLLFSARRSSGRPLLTLFLVLCCLKPVHTYPSWFSGSFWFPVLRWKDKIKMFKMIKHSLHFKIKKFQYTDMLNSCCVPKNPLQRHCTMSHELEIAGVETGIIC